MAYKRYIALAVGVLVGGAYGATLMDGGARLPLPGAASLASLLSDRSPGEREQGALSSKARVKVASVALPDRKPRPKVPVAAVLPAAVSPPVAALAPVAIPGALPVPVATLPLTAAAVPAGSSFFLPPIPFIPGGGGGTTTLVVTPPGGSGPPPGGENPPPPGPAVPEPATWLMLISGFGMLGFALRRRRRLANSGVPAPVHSRSALA